MIAMPNDVTKDELIVAMRRLLKTSARMYMFLARETIARFGREGEMTVRYGLRAFGFWRGREMREAHHAMGLPIDMRSLNLCWDNASIYLVKDAMATEGKFEPFDTRYDVRYCAASEAWKEGDFHQWGHAYCDEFHQACAAAYHPDGHVVIPINMMKGDDHCRFEWVMPPGAASLDLGAPSPLGKKLAQDYDAASEVEGAWKSLKRTTRLMGGRFYTIAKPLLERHGEAGRAVLRDGLVKWGEERGRILRREHEEAGLPVGFQSFIRQHDLPARYVWRVREIEMSPARAVLEIEETPHEEAWDDYQAGDIAQLWHEAAYPPMVATYLPGASARWLSLRGRAGAEASRLEMTAQ